MVCGHALNLAVRIKRASVASRKPRISAAGISTSAFVAYSTCRCCCTGLLIIGMLTSHRSVRNGNPFPGDAIKLCVSGRMGYSPSGSTDDRVTKHPDAAADCDDQRPAEGLRDGEGDAGRDHSGRDGGGCRPPARQPRRPWRVRPPQRNPPAPPAVRTGDVERRCRGPAVTAPAPYSGAARTPGSTGSFPPASHPACPPSGSARPYCPCLSARCSYARTSAPIAKRAEQSSSSWRGGGARIVVTKVSIGTPRSPSKGTVVKLHETQADICRPKQGNSQLIFITYHKNIIYIIIL